MKLIEVGYKEDFEVCAEIDAMKMLWSQIYSDC
jgi:hypothetical protein